MVSSYTVILIYFELLNSLHTKMYIQVIRLLWQCDEIQQVNIFKNCLCLCYESSER
jgi:hypothetical protein